MQGLPSFTWQQVQGADGSRGLETPSGSGQTTVAPAHLAIVAAQVEVDSLWGVPVPAAVARGEGHPHDAPAVAGGQPALLVVAPPAHGLLLLTLGDAALPGQAQDVGVAAKDRPLLHRCIHTFLSELFPLKINAECRKIQINSFH